MKNISGLAEFGAHQKALELFDLVVADLSPLTEDRALARLIGQQYASADSIAANIEEGYGRVTFTFPFPFPFHSHLHSRFPA